MTENYCILFSRNHMTALKAEMVIKQIGVEVLTVRSLLTLKNELASQPSDPMFILLETDNAPDDILQAASVKDVIGEVPLLVLGNEPRRDYLIEMLRAGACDFLVKPLDERLFSEKVNKALQRHLEAGPRMSEAARTMLRIELAKARKGKYALSVGVLTIQASGTPAGFELEQRYRRDMPAIFDALGAQFFETDLKLMVGLNSILVILPFCSGEQRSVFSEKVIRLFKQEQIQHPEYHSYQLTQAYRSEFEENERPDWLFAALVRSAQETRQSAAPD